MGRCSGEVCEECKMKPLVSVIVYFNDNFRWRDEN